MAPAGGSRTDFEKLYRLLQLQTSMMLPILMPPLKHSKKSAGSTSVVSQRDAHLRREVAAHLNVPEDVCMVLGTQLPEEVVCGGHIVPANLAVRLILVRTLRKPKHAMCNSCVNTVPYTMQYP